MPRMSMWHPNRNQDYQFADKTLAESIQIGGVGVLIHKYLHAGDNTKITDVQDMLFLENRDRHYDTYVYETRCHYNPVDTDYDLSQFGIFLSSDMMRFEFHYNEMIDLLGRKLVSGDVLEFPNMRDMTLEGIMINKFYVVHDALFSANGFSNTWFPHIWKVKGKQMTASQEYKDVIKNVSDGSTAGGMGAGMGLVGPNFLDMIDENGNPGPGFDQELKNGLDRYAELIGVTDQIVAEAEKNAFFDPKYYETSHLYITLDTDGSPIVTFWASGTSAPPNAAPLKGFGIQFPTDMIDGEYFVRTDFTPDRLFQKQGKTFKRIYDDVRKIWRPENQRLETYINNTTESTLDDGTVIRQKQPLSDTIPAKEDLQADFKDQIKRNEAARQKVAKDQDGAK